MSLAITLERAMKRQEIILRVYKGDLNWVQAADILGLTPRQMRRIKTAYEKKGFSCIVDQRYGKPSWNRAPVDEVKQVLSLYRDKYFDFSVQHFCEKLKDVEEIDRSYSWVKKILQNAALVSKDRKRKKHRRRRERKPLVGMMLHLDGSTHSWLGPDREQWDLLLMLDDANTEAYDGIFVEEEDTRSVMAVTRSVVEKKGIFCSLYSDRASHFVYTRKAGEPPDKTVITQCQRAFDQLGIRLIPANSPQARGRGERFWRTVQGRLPQELRLAGISTIEQANKYLKEVFIPDLNKRFMVEPKEKGSAFFPLNREINLDRIFSIQHERQVKNDNTVTFRNLILQIPKSPIRQHFVRCTVKVYEHLDETISIGYGPHTIGRYHKDGSDFLEEIPGQAPATLWGQNPSGLFRRPQGFAQNDPAGSAKARPIPKLPLVPIAKSQGELNARTY